VESERARLNCALKRKLLEEYTEAARKHLEAMIEAQKALDAPSEYRKAYLLAESARELAEQARLIYQRHVKTHRC